MMQKYSLIMLFSLVLFACDAKDACLDKGGSWQEEQQTCQQ